MYPNLYYVNTQNTALILQQKIFAQAYLTLQIYTGRAQFLTMPIVVQHDRYVYATIHNHAEKANMNAPQNVKSVLP